MLRPVAFVVSVVLYVVLPGPWEWLFFLTALGVLVSWVGVGERST